MALKELTFDISMNTEKVEKKAKNLNKELNAIFKVTGDKQLSSKMMAITNRLEKQQYKLYKTTEKLNEANKQVYTDQYKKLERDAERYFKTIQDKNAQIAQWEAQGGVGHGRGFLRGEKMEAHIAQTRTTINELETKLANARIEMEKLRETGKAFTFAGDEKELENIIKNMSFIEKDLQKNIAQLYEADKETANLVNNTTQLEDSVNGVSDGSEFIAKNFANANDSATDEANSIGTCSKEMANFISKSLLLNKVETVVTTITNVFRELGKIVAKIASRIAELAKRLLKRLGNAIKDVAKNMLKLNKESDAHNTSLKKMVNTMLKYGLGIRSVFILWRKLRAYAQDALKLMAQQFEEIDKTVSNIVNSFNQFKNSVGTLVEPLMSTFAPAIEAILGLLTRANEALANFFAILTGRTYIYRAKKSNDSYAESLKNVSDKAKEAKEELAAYDKLLVINSDDANKYGGANGDAEEVIDAFDKTLAQSEFAEQLKEAIEKDDWEGVGELFANKLNLLTFSLNNWITEKFAPDSKKWAKRLGDTLNGGIATYKWDKLGVTVGNGTNAILDAVNTFLTTFDGLKFGESIGTTIDEWFNTVNWDLAGETFGNKLNLVWDTAYGLLKSLNFGGMGEDLGTFLNSWSKTVKWNEIGKTVNTAVKGLLNFVEGALDTIKFDELGKNIGRATSEIDWGGIVLQLGRILLKAIKGAFKLLVGLVKEDPDILSAISAVFGVIFTAGLIKNALVKDKLTKSITDAITGALTNASTDSGVISGSRTLGSVISSILRSSITKAFLGIGAFMYTLVDKTADSSISKLEEDLGVDKLYARLEQLNKKGILDNLTMNKPRTAIEQRELDDYIATLEQIDYMTRGTPLENDLRLTAEQFKAISKYLHSTNQVLPDFVYYYDELYNMPKSNQKAFKLDEKTPQTPDSPVGFFNKLRDDMESIAKMTPLPISAKMDSKSKQDMEYATSHLIQMDKTHTAVLSVKKAPSFDATITDANTKISTIPLFRTATIIADTIKMNLFDNMYSMIKNITTPNWISTITAKTKDADKVNQLTTDINKVPKNTTAQINVVLSPWQQFKNNLTTFLDNAKQIINTEFIDKLNGLESKVGISTGGNLIQKAFGTTQQVGAKLFNFPRLAQGAVIPANREFLAVLGDQKQGTNIEAPLDTIVQAMQIALANNSGGHQDINLILDGRIIAKSVWSETEKKYKQTGVRFA